MGVSKLKSDQRAAVVRKYQEGFSPTRLAGEFGVSKRTIQRIVKDAGVSRSVLEGTRLARGRAAIEFSGVTRDALVDAYWGANSGLPSTTDLAERFGVSRRTLKRRLVEFGIGVRTKSQQKKIEFKEGRCLHDWARVARLTDQCGAKEPEIEAAVVALMREAGEL